MWELLTDCGFWAEHHVLLASLRILSGACAADPGSRTRTTLRDDVSRLACGYCHTIHTLDGERTHIGDPISCPREDRASFVDHSFVRSGVEAHIVGDGKVLIYLKQQFQVESQNGLLAGEDIRRILRG